MAKDLLFKGSRSRLPNKEFSIAKTAIAERKLDVLDCHNIDFGNRKRKFVYKIAYTIAASGVFRAQPKYTARLLQGGKECVLFYMFLVIVSM